MTRHTATCDTCGYTCGPAKTAKIAAFGLRQHSCDKHRAKQASQARRLAREAAVDKTPKPCHHKQANHQHGTHACYVLDRCRCPDCTTANTTYERQRARLHAYGRFDKDWVDGDTIRAHIDTLRAAGLGLKTIAARAGVSESTLGKLVYGNPVDGHKRSKRVRKGTADKLLAVRPGLHTLAAGAHIDGTGTRRRLQALMANGWSQSKLARRLGYELRNFCYLIHGKRDVTVTTARKVAALYEQLWDQPPPQETRGDKGAYTRSLGYAQAHGWVPPLAWDDETIDDPHAAPFVDEPAHKGGKVRIVHIDDIEWLLDHEPLATSQRLADRLGVTRDAVQNACRRADRQDLVDLLARNARLAKEGTTAA